MQWGTSFACMGMTVIFLMIDRAFLTATACAWVTEIRRARGLLNGRKIRKFMRFRNPVAAPAARGTDDARLRGQILARDVGVSAHSEDA